MAENKKTMELEPQNGISWINKNTVIPLSLVIVLITFTAYMERRSSLLESMLKVQENRIIHLETRLLPPNEVIYRLNSIERKIDKLESYHQK